LSVSAMVSVVGSEASLAIGFLLQKKLSSRDTRVTGDVIYGAGKTYQGFTKPPW
jgi:hypothetical protein